MSNRANNAARDVPKFTRIVPRGRWTNQAACADTDPNMWFLEDQGSYVAARTICAGCPVRPECLAWALETNTEHGMFGGLSPLERKKLRHGQLHLAETSRA